MTAKNSGPMRLEVVIKGDRRLAENVILEVRAVARRYGLEIPTIQVMQRPSVGPKAKLASRRRPRPGAR